MGDLRAQSPRRSDGAERLFDDQAGLKTRLYGFRGTTDFGGLRIRWRRVAFAARGVVRIRHG